MEIIIPVRQIPGTGEVYWSNPHTGDIIINLKNYPAIDNAIKNEDVVIVGDWSDYSGSGTKPIGQVTHAGVSNELAADLLATAAGNDFNAITNRGNIAATNRQRPRLVYIEKQ